MTKPRKKRRTANARQCVENLQRITQRKSDRVTKALTAIVCANQCQSLPNLKNCVQLKPTTVAIRIVTLATQRSGARKCAAAAKFHAAFTKYLNQAHFGGLFFRLKSEFYASPGQP
ncbi:hypothetical protein F9U39_01240 [Pectobacterium versatile]|uniref:hypothetical protein n=1 Tax=Pectobacterium versatile TaxID=2488639 RepID=UPI001B377E49|nr:hypothetical protein [Pectobacterium versatile]MBQ4788039.1 hypothetical protein [Pectobacterium versatile]